MEARCEEFRTTVENISNAEQKGDQAQVSKLIPAAKKMLVQLKIEMTKLTSLPPRGSNSPDATKERTLARSILESATILSIYEEDMAAFERNFTQLGVYYSDLAKDLPESTLHNPIVGTRLLQLLVENRLAEFHGELEIIPDQIRSDSNIAFPIQLEQYLMEGSYNKVLEQRSKVPNPFFKFFLGQLLETVRDNIADCLEVAYSYLKLDEAQKLLIFDSAKDLTKYIEEIKPEWAVRDGAIWFKTPEKSLGAQDIPSLRLVSESLSYATELDRIV